MFAGRPEEVAQPLASQGIGSDSVKIAFAPMADQPRLSFVMELRVEVAAPVEVGDVPGGRRRIVAIAGGTFDGPSIRGRILPGGADWQLIRPDGVAELDARYVLETDAGQVVYIRNRGLRHAAPEIARELLAGRPVDPALVYFRTSAKFETAAPELQWLTRAIFVGDADRHPDLVLVRLWRVE